jgi:hypothetical protein
MGVLIGKEKLEWREKPNGDAVLCWEGGVRHSYSVEKASNELAQMIMNSCQLAIIWSFWQIV